MLRLRGLRKQRDCAGFRPGFHVDPWLASLSSATAPISDALLQTPKPQTQGYPALEQPKRFNFYMGGEHGSHDECPGAKLMPGMTPFSSVEM